MHFYLISPTKTSPKKYITITGHAETRMNRKIIGMNLIFGLSFKEVKYDLKSSCVVAHALKIRKSVEKMVMIPIKIDPVFLQTANRADVTTTH